MNPYALIAGMFGVGEEKMQHLQIRPLNDPSVTHYNPKKGWPRVFVYGSLKRGLSNHCLFLNNRDDCHFLGTDVLRGPLQMITLGGFPGLIDMSVQDAVEVIPRNCVGEVWAVSTDLLNGPLDRLESNGRFYTRKKIPTSFKQAWCYFLPPYYSTEKVYKQLDPMIWMPTPEELKIFEKFKDAA